jgi:serine/threonine-protein kinase
MILYEMLSGSVPFGFGIEARSTSGVSWGIAHASKSPLPLRSQPGCEGLSAELEAIVMRCLCKLPERRFQSVVELSAALQSVSLTSLGNAAGFGFPSQSNSEVRAPNSPESAPVSREDTPPSVASSSSNRTNAAQTRSFELYQYQLQEQAPPSDRTDANSVRAQHLNRSQVQTPPLRQQEVIESQQPKKHLWLASSVGFALGVAGVALVAVIFYLYLLPKQYTPSLSPSTPPASPKPLEPW